MLRLACDVGGTFTDLVVADGGELRLYKAATTPDDPVRGVLARSRLPPPTPQTERRASSARVETFVHGTTHAINAILTGTTARTAFLTTQGHPDMLVFREGGRAEPFDFTTPYPEPYVPRALTFEIPERIMADGAVVTPLDEAAVRRDPRAARGARVEAIGVCLLWSIVNPAHELAVGELIAEHLPGVPFTLSHRSTRRSANTAARSSTASTPR